MGSLCESALWDTQLLFAGDYPQFTPCFQETLTYWIPCAFLWIFFLYEIYKIRHSNALLAPITVLFSAKLIFVGILCAISLLQAFLAYFSLNQTPGLEKVHYITPIIEFFSFIAVIFLMINHRKKNIHTSGVLFCFWILYSVGDTIRLYSVFKTAFDLDSSFEIPISPTFFVFRLLHYTFVVASLMLQFISDYKCDPNPKTSCPLNKASFLSQLTFWWFNKLTLIGLKKPLQQQDMWELDKENQTKVISKKFEKHWLPTFEKFQKSKPNSESKCLNITWPLIITFWPDLIVVIVCKFIASFLTFVNPFILDKLITFMYTDSPNWLGYSYAISMFGSACLESIMNNQYEYLIYVLAMRVRSALILVIYKKALTLSAAGRKNFTTGEIVNLMSVDVQKVIDYVQMVNLVWASTLQIIIGLYFLWLQLNLATLAGIAVMILMMPLNGVITNRLKDCQTQLMKNKDKRTKLLNEVLNGIKVLKLYAWEKSFSEKISAIRDKEIASLRKLMIIFSIILFTFNSVPFFVSMASFAVYVLIDKNNILDANKAFVSLTLFNILRVPLGLVPFLISNGVMCGVSIKRINRYLSGEELDNDAVSKDGYRTEETPYSISIKNGNFSWGDCENNFTETVNLTNCLKDIELDVKKGELVAIVGSVGSGKSSLLSALLGDMQKQSGDVTLSGRVAYVPQQAWIQNATLRDNILFAAPFVQSKYQDILKRAQLIPDLRILGAGDMTEIGEKGINLSGGQKQRVNIARALYSDADIYLFDDPLSALDAHVGREIFEKVISDSGLLHGKTRVLVTHRISLLPRMDKIIVMKDGQISESGSYEELLEKKGDFSELIVQFLAEQDQQLTDDIDVDQDDLAVLAELKEQVKPQLEQLQNSMSLSRGDARSRTDSYVGTSMEKSRRLSVYSSRLQRSESILTRSQSSVVEDRQTERKQKQSYLGEKGKAGRLTETEHVEVGSVKWKVYLDYIKALGVSLMFVTLGCYFLSHSCNVGTSLWLSQWADDALNIQNQGDTHLRNIRLIGYAAFGLGEAVFVMIATLTLNLACLAAAKLLHRQMLNKIVDAPMSFFDTTPLGRILNRFTKDIDTADFGICINVRGVIVYSFRALVSFLLISLETPFFLLTLLPLGLAYYALQKFYISTSRQLKRIESITRSPVYSHFQETVTGAQSIRAYECERRFVKECCHRVDENHRSYFPSLAALRWLTVRLEFLGYTIVFLAALFAVISRHSLSAGLAGVSISSALTITATLNMLVRSFSDLETNIVAIERCFEYTRLETEATEYKNNPPSSWPLHGRIQFDSYSTRYRSELGPVLQNLSFEIAPGEKVGIVGRTGAGKSSLTLALFRIIEATEGRISIDGQPINDVALSVLRSKLSIIPQEPALFSGTLRMNLDPFERFGDDQLWIALNQAHLREFVASCPGGLAYEIGEGGDNLSVGQRQLVCLARALLRHSKILVLDEATAAVDFETDELIQKTIRAEFARCTIVTIAHRLNTILDYDRVIVLSQGKLAEFDSPKALLENPESIFYSMAKDSNII